MDQHHSSSCPEGAFPIETVRRQFPALSRCDDKRPRVYLDNPAGTQVPQRVVDAVSHCLVETNANLGGFFGTSVAAGKVVAGAHAAMADLLGTKDPGEIIIGASMTTLTFHVSRSICQDFEPGDEIIVTRMDHEGNIAPWLDVAKDLGLVVRWADFSPHTWRVEVETIRALLSPRTKLLALSCASNMTGAVNDVKSLTQEAQEVGALVYVDAVQFAPHGLIDVEDLGCDFLACSSYKFCGPHLGVLWGRRALLEAMRAFKVRCVGEKLPHKFETGTPAIELLAGLLASIEYFAWLGEQVGGAGGRREKIEAAFGALKAYEEQLATELLEGLAGIPGVEIIGPPSVGVERLRVPTVSFRPPSVLPAHVAQRLGEENIFVWNGHNYALETVRQLGIPETEGVVRIGAAHYNTKEEILLAVDAVRRAVRGA